MTTLEKATSVATATALLAVALACPAEAQTRLLADIGTAPQTIPTAEPRQFFGAGDVAFFLASEPGTGLEVYATDGTAAGTELLRDSCPGPCGSVVSFQGTVDGRTVWVGTGDGWQTEYALWASDGSREGTVRLSPEGVAVFPGFSDSTPETRHNYAWLDDDLYFQACEDTACALWRTGGTAASTEPVSAALGLPEDAFWTLVPAGDRLYLVSTDAIWRTNGVTAQRVIGLSDHSIAFLDRSSLTGVAGKLFFVANQGSGEELWVSDGSGTGTRSISNFPNHQPFPFDAWLKPVGEEVYFLADDVVHGVELWVADGTPEGTRRITDFGYHDPFGDPYDAERLQVIDGTVLFVATDGLSEQQIWTTNGDPGSTTPLVAGCTGGCVDPWAPLIQLPDAVIWKSGGGGSGQVWSTGGTAATTTALSSSGVGFLRQLGDEVVFSLVGGGAGELWATDGSAAATRPITDLPGLTPQAEVARVGGGFVFPVANAGTWQLWFTDGSGSAAGTRRIADLSRSIASSHPLELVDLGDRLVVNACEGHARFLWSMRNDGSQLTKLLQSGFNCSDDASLERVGLSSAAGLAFWALNRSFEPSELWRSDGTVGGTVKILSIDGQFVGPASLGEAVYFLVTEPHTSESELWRSDGTAAGTQPVLEVDGAPWGWLRRAGDLLLAPISRDDAIHLLRSDGTAGGTWEVGGSFQTLFDVVAAGPWLFFGAQDEQHGVELWWSDGSPAPATRLTDLDVSCCGDELRALTAHGDEAYFFAVAGARWGFFRASPAGTEQLADFPLSDHMTTGDFDLVSFADRLLFAADDGEHGFEPWVSDGTAGGTHLLADLYPGRIGSDPAEMTVVGDRVLFAARDPFYGRELHVTDGTAAGTSLVADIFAGGHSSAPQHFTAIGSTLYFSADDGVHGHELWSWNAGAHPAPPPGPWLTSAAVPGFRFKVRITNQQGEPLAGAQEPACIAETLCVSGALAGRSEVFLRVVGPKPNGLLWPTLVKFSTSQVEVWVEQEGSGELRYYLLEGAAPGFDQLPGMFDRLGFQPRATSGGGVAAPVGVSTPIAPGAWFTSGQFPGFRFRVRISNQQGQESPLQLESDCIEETVCLSGAVPGRSELFLRIVGPKPNGYLWPTLVKFSTSTIDVWIEQTATATEKHYHLEGAAPGVDDLSGLFDRTGFLP